MQSKLSLAVSKIKTQSCFGVQQNQKPRKKKKINNNNKPILFLFDLKPTTNIQSS